MRALRPWNVPAMASIALLVVLAAGPAPAAAHDHLYGGPHGEYGLTVGWRVEPPVVGVLNGLDLAINYSSNATMYEGAETGLTTVLSFGTYSVTKAIVANEDRGPGWYTFDVIPTREGTYKVRIMGSLLGIPVDVNVTLDDVAARSTIEFPVTDPTPSDLQSSNAALQAQVGSAVLVGALGAILGLVGIGVAVVAMRRSRPRQ